jgi:hypothetical protein
VQSDDLERIRRGLVEGADTGSNVIGGRLLVEATKAGVTWTLDTLVNPAYFFDSGVSRVFEVRKDALEQLRLGMRLENLFRFVDETGASGEPSFDAFALADLNGDHVIDDAELRDADAPLAQLPKRDASRSEGTSLSTLVSLRMSAVLLAE